MDLLPKVPEAGAPLWRIFCELHRCRGSTGYGPAPITLHDIEAWSRLIGGSLEGWEIKALLEIDGAFLAFAAQEAARVKT